MVGSDPANLHAPLADIALMMMPADPLTPSGFRSYPGRVLLASVILVMTFGLVIGTVFILRDLAAAPAEAKASSDGAQSQPVNLSADSVEAALRAAAVYKRDGQFAEAATILRSLVQSRPNDQELRLALAHALVGMRDYAAAYRQYEAAIAIGQGRHRDDSGGEAIAALHFQAGMVAWRAGLHDRAEEHFSMAQSENPSEPQFPLYLAIVQAADNNRQEAAANALRAVTLQPSQDQGWFLLAQMELEQNRLGLAQQHIERARSIRPEQVAYRVLEARIWNRRGEPERAATLLLGLEPSAREQVEVMETLAQAYGLMGRIEEAKALSARAQRKRQLERPAHQSVYPVGDTPIP